MSWMLTVLKMLNVSLGGLDIFHWGYFRHSIKTDALKALNETVYMSDYLNHDACDHRPLMVLITRFSLTINHMVVEAHRETSFPIGTAHLTWFFRSSLGHGRPPLNGFSRSHLDLIFSPLPQEALQADHGDQSLSLQSRGQGMWQTSSTRPAKEHVEQSERPSPCHSPSH